MRIARWALCVGLATAAAADKPIGLIEATAGFRLDGATMPSNGTLFEGARIDSERALVRATLDGGASVSISPGSAVRVFRASATIERSTGVEVAAGRTAYEVRNPAGVLLARIGPGKAVTFKTATSPEATVVHGYLRTAGGRFLLMDETAKVTFELRGDGLDKEIGNLIQVSGIADPFAKPFLGAAQVIRVSSLVRLTEVSNVAAAAGRGGPSTASATSSTAASAAARSSAPTSVSNGTEGTTAAAHSAGGIGGGLGTTTIAVIGGVTVAGVAGGLAASGALSSAPAPPISR